MSVDDGKNNYNPRPINPEDKSYRDVMMLFSDHPVKPKYWFEDFGEYWSCSCGQINREETCSNCGLSRELLRRIFVLHKPGEDRESTGSGQKSGGDLPAPHADPEKVSAAAGEKISRTDPQKESDGADGSASLQKTEEAPPVDGEQLLRKRKRRARIIVLVLLFLILLLAGGLAAFYFYYLPALNEQDEKEADVMADTLVRELPAVMGPISGANFSIYRNAGDQHYEKKEFVEAIGYYNKALKIRQDESVRQKILDAKYSYVANNQETGGKTFKKYLEELKKTKYPGIENVYERTYSWKAKIVTNTGSNDFSTDMDRISRSNLVYFHTSISGGAPGDALNLYYEIVWPDGTSERKDVSASKASGDSVTTRCEYTFPKTADEVQMTYRLYNYEDNSLLASDSITLL